MGWESSFPATSRETGKAVVVAPEIPYSVAVRGPVTVPEHASLEQLAGALHEQLVLEQDGPLWDTGRH